MDQNYLNMTNPPRTPNKNLQAQYRQNLQNYVSPIRNTRNTRISYGPRGAGAYSSVNNINMSAKVPNSSKKKLQELLKQYNEAIAIAKEKQEKADANSRRAKEKVNTKRVAHQTTLNRFGFMRNGKKGGTRRIRKH